MPYKKTADLPDSVKNVLPPHAQDIFMAAFNSAYDGYKDPEDREGDESRDEVAFKVAWSAVKRDYEKGADGTWHPKE
jgi:cation transport regulator